MLVYYYSIKGIVFLASRHHTLIQERFRKDQTAFQQNVQSNSEQLR